MALKRRTKINENYSMASMTDVIFLLLIFFMISSTGCNSKRDKSHTAAITKADCCKTAYQTYHRRGIKLRDVAFGNQREVTGKLR